MNKKYFLRLQNVFIWILLRKVNKVRKVINNRLEKEIVNKKNKRKKENDVDIL